MSCGAPAAACGRVPAPQRVGPLLRHPGPRLPGLRRPWLCAPMDCWCRRGTAPAGGCSTPRTGAAASAWAHGSGRRGGLPRAACRCCAGGNSGALRTCSAVSPRRRADGAGQAVRGQAPILQVWTRCAKGLPCQANTSTPSSSAPARPARRSPRAAAGKHLC